MTTDTALLDLIRKQRNHAEAEVHRLTGELQAATEVAVDFAAELERLRADLPDIECPACGATIRAGGLP